MEKGVNHLKAGRLGEDLALNYLKKNGYRVVERNFRCNLGEIDIIATEGKTVVFVEVKSRWSERFGSPQMAVDTHKQKRISRVALVYMKSRGLKDRSARFDVVAVRFFPEGPRIELIRNAFDLQFG